ncbi:MAG: carboxypeptidase regulatory-like domain-containing protein [Desulfobulbus sp.]|nr:carboxypeptidase regulatory-like domain-containing protein [Desulfobulbus sp.]
MHLIGRIVVVVLLFLGCSLAPAWAHKVNIFAYSEDGKIYTESYFADGQKVIGCQVEVLDAAGKQLLEGKTDAKGLFAFPLAHKQTLTIIVNAGMGHKNSYVLKQEEM